MKNKTYTLNTILTAVLAAVLAVMVVLRAFAPNIILPKFDIPMLTAISLAALVLDHYLAPGAKRCYPWPCLWEPRKSPGSGKICSPRCSRRKKSRRCRRCLQGQAPPIDGAWFWQPALLPGSRNNRFALPFCPRRRPGGTACIPNSS